MFINKFSYLGFVVWIGRVHCWHYMRTIGVVLNDVRWNALHKLLLLLLLGHHHWVDHLHRDSHWSWLRHSHLLGDHLWLALHLIRKGHLHWILLRSWHLSRWKLPSVLWISWSIIVSHLSTSEIIVFLNNLKKNLYSLHCVWFIQCININICISSRSLHDIFLPINFISNLFLFNLS